MANPIYRPRPRVRRGPVYRCTRCQSPLVTVTANIAGRVVDNALACSACGRLGVHCSC